MIGTPAGRAAETAREDPSPYPCIAAAHGNWLFADGGARLLDASSGLWTTSLGHGQTRVIGAISEALTALTFTINASAKVDLSVRLRRRLLRHAPGMDRVAFYTSGTAAVEASLALARHHFEAIGERQRDGIIALEHCYHGASFLTSRVSDEGGTSSGRAAPVPIFHIPTPAGQHDEKHALRQLRDVLDQHGKSCAAFLFEPVQAHYGMRVVSREWLGAAVELCRRYGVLIIADEVATSIGRTGDWFCADTTAVDIAVVGKGLGAGYMPISAILFRDRLAGVDPSEFGSTMDGFPAACAAGLAVLDILEEQGLIERVRHLGALIQERLRAAVSLPVVGALNGRGLLLGLELVDPRGPNGQMSPRSMWEIHKKMAAEGLMFAPAATMLAIVPPFTITDEEAEELCSKILMVLNDLS